MEPKDTEWKALVNAYNQREIKYCPYCERSTAVMNIRYHTNRDGETERQYRVECPVCKHTGKTYLHESVAAMSWEVRENDPEPPFFIGRRRRTEL